MPVVINEVNTEIHAFDASALLSDEVIRALAPRIAAELRRIEADAMQRERDAKVIDARRARR
jgi:hypothetical protein